MMNYSTNSRAQSIPIYILLFILLLSHDTNAQTINTITITSPASIAGDYPFALALFGEQIDEPFSGKIKIVDDEIDPNTNGCEPGDYDI